MCKSQIPNPNQTFTKLNEWQNARPWKTFEPIVDQIEKINNELVKKTHMPTSNVKMLHTSCPNVTTLPDLRLLFVFRHEKKRIPSLRPWTASSHVYFAHYYVLFTILVIFDLNCANQWRTAKTSRLHRPFTQFFCKCVFLCVYRSSCGNWPCWRSLVFAGLRWCPLVFRWCSLVFAGVRWVLVCCPLVFAGFRWNVQIWQCCSFWVPFGKSLTNTQFW